MTEWQPIETAPRDGSWFIVYIPDNPMVWGNYELSAWMKVGNEPGYFCQTDVSEELEGATHWMPLPAKAPDA